MALTSLLVANRGEIACRILRTARAINGGQADIATVAKLVGQWAGKEIPKTR